MTTRLASLVDAEADGSDAAPTPRLLDALRTEEQRVKLCIVGRWFDTLDDTDRADAEQWLEQGRRKSSLLRVARVRGYRGSGAMFYAHTLGTCCCPAEAAA